MCSRCPASGTSPRSWSAAGSARSGTATSPSGGGRGAGARGAAPASSRWPAPGRFAPRACRRPRPAHRSARSRAATASGRSAPPRTASPRRDRRGQAVDGAHRFGVGVVPDRACPRAASRAGKRAPSASISARSGRLAPSARECAGLDGRCRARIVSLVRRERDPRACCSSGRSRRRRPSAPWRSRVGLGGALETGHGLLVVEAIRPDEPAVEPALGLGGHGRAGDCSAEVVRVFEHGGAILAHPLETQDSSPATRTGSLCRA